jgi:hypothetical protein
MRVRSRSPTTLDTSILGEEGPRFLGGQHRRDAFADGMTRAPAACAGFTGTHLGR